MTADTDRATGLAEWRAGWLIVITACLGVGFSQLHFIILGFMIGPMEAELGWSRGDITVVGLVFSLLVAAVAPFAGRVIDRADERWIGIPAIAAYCGFTALLSQAGPGIWTWWAIWAGIAIVSPPASVLFWTTVIARRFDKQRGLALGAALCGTAIASAVMPTLALHLIDAYGWRGGYLRIGLVSALIIVPLALFALRPGARRAAPLAPRNVQLFKWGEALRSPRFLRIALAGTVLSITAAAIAVHFVPALIHWGITKETAAIASGLTGIGALIGRLCTGALLDRSRGPLMGGLIFLVPMIPCALMLGLEPAMAAALVIGLLFGLASGGEVDVISYFIARYYGAARYGSVYGAAYAFIGAAAGIGPWVAGLIYDATGSYTILFAGILPMAVLAALLLVTIGPYPPSEELPLAQG